MAVESQRAFDDWADGICSRRLVAPQYQTFRRSDGTAGETEVGGTRVEIEQGPALMVVAHEIGDLKQVEQASQNSEGGCMPGEPPAPGP